MYMADSGLIPIIPYGLLSTLGVILENPEPLVTPKNPCQKEEEKGEEEKEEENYGI